jgi:hypothetical protein
MTKLDIIIQRLNELSIDRQIAQVNSETRKLAEIQQEENLLFEDYNDILKSKTTS